MKTPKRDQWVKLLRSLEVSPEEIDRAETKEPTRNYIAELSDVYSSSEWQIAIGAYASNERALSEELHAIAAMLKNCTSLSDKDLAPLLDQSGSSEFSVSGSHVLDKIVFDPQAKELVWQGVERSLAVREDFLQGLEKYLEG